MILCALCLTIRFGLFCTGNKYSDALQEYIFIYYVFQFMFELLLLVASGVIFSQVLEWLSQIYIIQYQRNKDIVNIYSDHVNERIRKSVDLNQLPEQVQKLNYRKREIKMRKLFIVSIFLRYLLKIVLIIAKFVYADSQRRT